MESWPPHKHFFARLRGSEGALIDQVMAVFHPGPQSYTGEDVAEISCHGNPLLVDTLLDVIHTTHLARLAQQGEFTRRAYLNAKMDLAQAEAVGAIISAGSSAGIEMAKSLLDGDLSRSVEDLDTAILDLLALIEASFIADDVEITTESIIEAITPILHKIEDLLKDHDAAPSLLSGISTTIAGLPNAGKSSLFNAILGYPRAIVHAEGGTTRDIIHEHVTIEGIDFVFHDTAGIRETSSGPEKIGVEKTIEKLAQSDLVLYVVDAGIGLQPDEHKWLDLGEKTIVVMNKIDLLDAQPHKSSANDTVWISAKYGQGIAELLGLMTHTVPDTRPKVFIQRHAYLLEKARTCLVQAEESAGAGMTADVLTIDLSHASSFLQEIIGKEVDEDMLNRIFSQFCVGK